jgi:hypothetical protein
LLTVFAAIGLVVIILAYNAGAARRVSPSTRTIAPSVFAQSLPVIPIKLGVHKAAWGEGYVVTFVNDGERYLKFTVTHKRTTLNQGGTFELRLQPNTSVEQGWNEGHTFYPGDTVIIEHPEFSRREIIVDPSQKVGFRLVTGTL